MNIISKTNLWLSISAALMIASIVCLAVFGLKLGIDFTGGSLLEINYNVDRPQVSEIRQTVDELGLGTVNIQPIGEYGAIFRLKDVNEQQHQDILNALRTAVQPAETEDVQAEEINVNDKTIVIDDVDASGTAIVNLSADDSKKEVLEELRFDSVGASIGQELKEKSFYAAIIVLILIVAYIAYSFKKVSKPVASWKYGIAAIVALFHDVLIVLGVFALLGKYMGVEIDTAFVAAVLTVLGYSVNDTIVVFDRIRENLPKSEKDFAGTVNDSLIQTFGRSINTSFTTLLVLLALLFWGGSTIHYFVLALVIGIASGTYSSIFLASPLLVAWEKWSRK
ncbi:protein translocase subunit SecF [Candidatus Falkowbacteria bacterium CG10_big_fil_rev_8_21_14_0_10_37_6]|uniref:Protein-export membrane protein SecF n=1 Tax=Candidatus Falkowbacteria bacterium CG10_big_fil_rev_8_21_14_0_10_37_6 TaxID=1974563 RepID=A0A2H0V6X4_9BACT|nr:MAG: protein translocase subunit SecF [Candidatus Falkowbacteria bacterium CG10_big_fil_rev_8_21_14_0_10_37_6]